MNVKKTVKKIAAIGAGALLVGSTLLGASAANLQDFPQPFVSNGQGDVQFVIGSGATDDYLGALDIAVALQAAAVTESTVNLPGTGTTVEVEGGYNLAGRGSLYLGDSLDVRQLRNTQLTELLADGEIRYNNEDYETYQTLNFGSSTELTFDTVDDEPLVFIDAENGYLWNYTLNIKGNLNITDFDGSEKVIMFGKTFTFAPDQKSSGEVKLFGSDETVSLDYRVPQTISVDGKSYTIEVITALDETEPAVLLNINGEQQKIYEGGDYNIAGLDVVVQDIFITRFDETALVNLFVGSEEILIKDDGRVEMGGTRIRGLESNIDLNNGILESLSIAFSPVDLNSRDISGFDKQERIEIEDSVVDPLFGTFEVTFPGMSLELDDSAKTMVSLKQNNENVEITFTNNEGDEITFKPYVLSSSNVAEYDDFVVKNTTTALEKDEIFAIGIDTDYPITKVYEIEEIYTDDISDNYVVLYDIASRTDTGDLKKGDYIGNSDVKIQTINDTGLYLNSNTSKNLYLDGGESYLELDAAEIKLVEGSVPTDVAPSVTFTVNFTNDGSDIIVDGIANNSTVWTATSDKEEESYMLSNFGTYVVRDDDDDTYVNFYVPKEKDMAVEYNVFVAPTGAEVVTGGSDGSTVKTQAVNPFSVGLAVRDTDVNLATANRNLIVIGGTCVNSIAAELKEVAAGTCGLDSGLSPNEAIVELFDLDSGKVAMLVAGWEAVETQAAARAVATGREELTGRSATLQVTSATNYVIN